MKTITDHVQVERCGKLVNEMMLIRTGGESEFDPNWVRQHGWKIAPVESAMRLPDEDIPGLVSTLKAAGYTKCLAVFNEPCYIQRLPLFIASESPSDISTCHVRSVDEADFREFKR